MAEMALEMQKIENFTNDQNNGAQKFSGLRIHLKQPRKKFWANFHRQIVPGRFWLFCRTVSMLKDYMFQLMKVEKEKALSPNRQTRSFFFVKKTFLTYFRK